MAGIRTDPGLSDSQLADDPILEHSAAHQPPWDPRNVCMHLCMCVCGACVYRHVETTNVSVCVFAGMQLDKHYVCVCVRACADKYVLIRRKERLSEIKQRLSVRLMSLFLKAGCDHLGHGRRTE